MADVFLSYASEDRPRAQQLASGLAAKGWSVWWDRTIVPGATFRIEIAQQIATARCVLVLWSRHSIASNFVLDEADEARQRNALVQALVEPVKPPLGFRQYQLADLTQWSGDVNAVELDRLADGIDSSAAGHFQPSTRHSVAPARLRSTGDWDRRRARLAW